MRHTGQRCLNSIVLRQIVQLVFITVAVTHGLSPECKSNLNNQLLLAEESQIWALSSDGKSREFLANTQSAISIDYSYAKNTLYWTDLETRQIYALKDKSTKPKVVIASQNNWLPFSIAVDDVTDKIYVAEGFSNTVGVFDLKNNDFNTVVIGGNLTDVHDVEIDLHEGYLFVLDKFQIVRTNMDGSNSQIIYLEYGNFQEEIENLNYKFPSLLPNMHLNEPAKKNHSDKYKYRKPLNIADITLDSEKKRIYWIDTKKRSLNSLNYAGKDKKVHFRDSENESKSFDSFSPITLFNGFMYWADDFTKNIFKIDLNNNNKIEVIQKNVTPRSIKFINCLSYKKILDPCENFDIKCQHLCLLSRNNEKSCACKVGYELANDGRSCEPVQDFILFTMYGYLRGLSSNINSKSEVINPWEFEVGQSTIIDYNVADSIVYYTSGYPHNQLQQLNLKTKKHQILKPDNMSQDVHHFTYDWTTKNLYYFTLIKDSLGSFSLRVLNVDDPSYSKIVFDSVYRLIRGVVVHPHRGYIYYAQYVDDKHGRICRVNTDGSDFTILIDLGDKVIVDGLSLDFEEDRLYWIQWQSKIYHSNLNGQDIQEISLPKAIKTLSDMTIHTDYIYAISDNSIVRFNKKTNSSLLKFIENQDRQNALSGIKLNTLNAQNVYK